MIRKVVLAGAVLAAVASGLTPGATALNKDVLNFGELRTVSQNIGAGAGPLTTIALGDELSCQVAYKGADQVYRPGTRPADCGTFLAVGPAPSSRTLYAPDFPGHGITATGALGARVAFTPVTQTPPSGSGTLADPYIVTTVVDAGDTGDTGLRITQMDTYITGRRYFRSDIVVSNRGTTTKRAVLSRGVDCYLAGSDAGVGAHYASSLTESGTTVACVKPNSTRAERLIPLSPLNSFYENSYSSVWSKIGAKASLPNTSLNTQHDNGMAIAWEFNVPPNGSVLRSLHHDFLDGGVVVADSPADPAFCTVAVDGIDSDTPSGRVSCATNIPAVAELSGACTTDAVISTAGGAAAWQCATPVGSVGCAVTASPARLADIVSTGTNAQVCAVSQATGSPAPADASPARR